MEADLISRLETNLAVLNAQLNNRQSKEFYFTPNPESWSMIQVLSHLVDEEIHDFRARLFSVVEDPSQPLTPFDPLATMANKNFVDEDFNELLDQLMDERLKSVAMLNALDDSDWDKAFIHPEKGALPARFFLTNWVAHDYIHIQQLNRLAYQFLANRGEVLDYAGNFRTG